MKIRSSNLTQKSSERSADRSLGAFVRSWWHQLLGIDGRLPRTLRSLLFNPGKLPLGSLEGDARFLSPIRVYLVVNFLFFLFVPYLNSDQGTVWNMTGEAVTQMPPDTSSLLARGAAAHADADIYRALFDERVRSAQGVFVVVMIPPQAVILFLLFRRRRRFFADHLLFATVQMAWYLLTLLVFGSIVRLALATPIRGFPAFFFVLLSGLLLVWLPLGMWRALRTFYGLGRLLAALLTAPLLLAFVALMLLYGKLLFFYGLWTLRV